MLVMGVDPGTRRTGYALVEKSGNFFEAIDYGVIVPRQNLDLSKRYALIFEELDLLLNKYQPKAVSVETQFVFKNVQSALKLGMARGICVVVAARKDIPVFEYSPNKAKSSVVGNGKASKVQVQQMVKVLLSLDELPQEDSADALALAICHLQSRSSNALLGNLL